MSKLPYFGPFRHFFSRSLNFSKIQNRKVQTTQVTSPSVAPLIKNNPLLGRGPLWPSMIQIWNRHDKEWGSLYTIRNWFLKNFASFGLKKSRYLVSLPKITWYLLLQESKICPPKNRFGRFARVYSKKCKP